MHFSYWCHGLVKFMCTKSFIFFAAGCNGEDTLINAEITQAYFSTSNIEEYMPPHFLASGNSGAIF